MIFKRRDPKTYLRAVVEFVWPRGGWARAFHYVRHRLRRLPDSPERIARGMWAGVFAAFTPFYGLHERLRYLIEHHEDHLLALEEACLTEACSAMELLPVLFKRPLDGHNLSLALGECIAHLNYLHLRGQIERGVDEKGCYRYLSVDTTLPMRLRKQRHAADDAPPMQV